MCTEFLLQLHMRDSLPLPSPLTPTFPLPFYTVFVSVVWVGSKKQKSVRDWATSMTLYLMYKKGALVILCT